MVGLLGTDTALVKPRQAQERILAACQKAWFERNKRGDPNYGDCSGFVKAVQGELHLLPFVGLANSIFHEVDQRSDWCVLGTGSIAATHAGSAANAGFFTIAVWENPEFDEKNVRKAGHIAIITAYLPLLGGKPEQRAVGAWGQLNNIGTLFGRMSKSFGSPKHSSIKYAKCLIQPSI
jgi:hypothetical protein